MKEKNNPVTSCTEAVNDSACWFSPCCACYFCYGSTDLVHVSCRPQNEESSTIQSICIDNIFDSPTNAIINDPRILMHADEALTGRRLGLVMASQRPYHNVQHCSLLSCMSLTYIYLILLYSPIYSPSILFSLYTRPTYIYNLFSLYTIPYSIHTILRLFSLQVIPFIKKVSNT